MKPVYSNEHSNAKVALSTTAPGIYEVTNVFTEPAARKQGYATQLMREICTAADASREVLMLMCKPELSKWYARHGFSVIQKAPLLMIRMPHIFKVNMTPVAQAAQAVSNG